MMDEEGQGNVGRPSIDLEAGRTINTKKSSTNNNKTESPLVIQPGRGMRASVLRLDEGASGSDFEFSEDDQERGASRRRQVDVEEREKEKEKEKQHEAEVEEEEEEDIEMEEVSFTDNPRVALTTPTQKKLGVRSATNHANDDERDSGESDDAAEGRGHSRRKLPYFDFEVDEDDLTLDDSGSSSISFPLILDYSRWRHSVERTKEWAKTNQNKAILGIIIGVTVLAFFSLLLSFSFKTLDFGPTLDEEWLIANTAQGKIRGLNTTSSRVFLGVPYAQAPINHLRWRPPRSPHFSDHIYNATSFKSSCIQSIYYNLAAPLPHSEDCLYLNIYTPLNISESSPLPVIVYLHGGSFLYGSGRLYSGESWAAKNIIFVNVNYRLGALGFMSLPQLDNEDDNYRSSGMYGILDQRAALQWVQTNIHAFGGDPKRVTLMGSSAGAISACVHLAAPQSAGLFNHVIMQSGLCNVLTKIHLQGESLRLVEDLGCAEATDVIECMRNINGNDTVYARLNATWGPAVDGYDLLHDPIEYIANGQANPIDGILLGTNHDEDAFFLCEQYSDLEHSEYDQYIHRLYDEPFATDVLLRYPAHSYGSPIAALIDALSDRDFKCPTKLVADIISHSASTYMYSFDYVAGFSQFLGECYQAAHTFELPFLFPTLLESLNLPYQFTVIESQLSDFMITAWSAFAQSNNPNAESEKSSWARRREAGEEEEREIRQDEQETTWPLYSNTTEPREAYTKLISLLVTEDVLFRSETCPLWRGVDPSFDRRWRLRD